MSCIIAMQSWQSLNSVIPNEAKWNLPDSQSYYLPLWSIAHRHKDGNTAEYCLHGKKLARLKFLFINLKHIAEIMLRLWEQVDEATWRNKNGLCLLPNNNRRYLPILTMESKFKYSPEEINFCFMKARTIINSWWIFLSFLSSLALLNTVFNCFGAFERNWSKFDEKSYSDHMFRISSWVMKPQE